MAETRISVPPCVPRYDTFQTSTIVANKFRYQTAIAIDEATHQIFITNMNKHIGIFSETGEFICQLGAGQLIKPSGIAIHGDSVYVSSYNDHTVSKFSLTEMCLVRRIGGRGSDNGQFILPQQLTTDPIGRVFIADSYNNRICIHDPDLNHLRNITLPSMSQPYDVKVSHDRLYVLCPVNNPCLHVLTLEGDKLHSLIACGLGMDVFFPNFICLDPLNNFVISDRHSNTIRVFSPEGNLLHTIGREGHQQRMFYSPRAIAITPNGRLVCVSLIGYYGLQIFC